MTTESEGAFQKLELSPEAARCLKQHNFVRDLDRSGTPHLLVKVPDLEQALSAEVGVEVEEGAGRSIVFSVLLYDIPSEPVSYELRLRAEYPEDQTYLRSLLDSAKFSLHPCGQDAGEWLVGTPRTFEIPTDVLLRMRHYAREWPGRQEAPSSFGPEMVKEAEPSSAPTRSLDPRDTVIRKLKEQVQTLRDLLQERDKRIIELEDELSEIKSRGRPYKLSAERKPWWKPFS